MLMRAAAVLGAVSFLAACGSSCGNGTAGPPGGVPLYGRFEAVVTNNNRYDNPFADVVLNATYTAPSGRRVPFLGFYDGDGQGGQNGNVWKLRFMPDELGDWTYTASFSDGQPGATGAFAVVALGAMPGPLQVDASNPRWFVFANGDRFYPRGYYYSEAFSATDAYWKNDLDTFFGPTWGFNFICTIFWQAEALSDSGFNARPFNGFHPVLPGQVTRLDLASWRHVDEVLEHLESLGVVWFNFDGFIANEGGERPGNQTEEQVLLRNWIARLAPYWNVTWNVAFEWGEFMSSSDVNRVANYVDSIDPWDHLLSVHDHGIGSEPSGSDGWLDFFTIQEDAGVARSAEQANEAVLAGPGTKPVYAQEVVWEGEQDGKLNEVQVRYAGWGVITAAGVLNYAEQFLENGGFAFGDGGGLPFVKIMFDVIERLPYWEMEPRNDLVTGAFCLANAGEVYLVYNQASGSFMIDLSDASAQDVFDVEWVNPVSGERHSGGTVNGGASRSLTAPFSGDAALVVERQ